MVFLEQTESLCAQTLDVGCLLSFWTTGDLKLYGLTFAKGLKTISHNRAVMHEHVLAILRGDEPVAFLIRKPLHCTFWHCPCYFSFFVSLSDTHGTANNNDRQFEVHTDGRPFPNVFQRPSGTSQTSLREKVSHREKTLVKPPLRRWRRIPRIHRNRLLPASPPTEWRRIRTQDTGPASSPQKRVLPSLLPLLQTMDCP